VCASADLKLKYQMLSKRSLPYNPQQVPDAKRFRLNLADLFLTNTVSAKRAVGLFADAHSAGTQHIKDLAKIGSSAGSRNSHRDLLRKLAKTSQWPKLYFGGVRVWNRRTQAVEIQHVPVLLPHEVFASIAGQSDIRNFASRAALIESARDHLVAAEQNLGPGAPIVSIGLWIDGTPCNWDRSEGVESFVVSCPGVSGQSSSVRIPFAVMMQKHCVAEATFDDLLTIFVWSLKWLALGTYPTARHDGHPWSPTDRRRQKLAGTALPVRGLLVEIRGDWKCMKEVFRLPGWQGSASSKCCWKCSADHTTRKDCSATAPWRTERLSHWDMLARWREQGVKPCTIIGAPFFDMRIFQLDWLHVMDLGVSCEFMGNVFTLLLKHYPGPNQKARAQELYKAMVEYYTRTGTDSRLDTLTLTMLQKTGAPPKLRARGAEARGLINFTREQAEAYFDDNDPEEGAAKQAAIHLQACYQCLHGDGFNHDVLREHSRKFCIQFAALEATLGDGGAAARWRLKPKIHQMQELCEESCHNPSQNWTYRDEDFGGSMAAFARVRGGKATAKVVGYNVLLKFQARHELPAF
jgi:hypothetical protein